MNLTDARLQVSGGCEKLELAMLSFFEQFRKIYVGDQVCDFKTRPSGLSFVTNVLSLTGSPFGTGRRCR